MRPREAHRPLAYRRARRGRRGREDLGEQAPEERDEAKVPNNPPAPPLATPDREGTGLTRVARRELAFIEARNEHVKEGLQEAYASRAPGRELEVFCVSNRLYDKYARKGDAEVVRASMVPAVRRHCRATGADAQLRGARHYLRSELFGLLNSLRIWCGSALREGEEARSVEETRRVLFRALDDAVCPPSTRDVFFLFCFGSGIWSS